MKKMLKYGFIVLILFAVIKIVANKLFDNRPFKFEKYRSSKSFDEAVNSKFIIGGIIEPYVKILEQSGAKCHKFSSSDKKANYKTITSCEYNSSFFSLNPLEYYRIDFCGDDENKLVELGTLRVTGLILIIP